MWTWEKLEASYGAEIVEIIQGTEDLGNEIVDEGWFHGITDEQLIAIYSRLKVYFQNKF